MKNIKMPKKTAEAWLNALRSGNYMQTTNHLRGGGPEEDAKELGYCCLGVLMDCISPDDEDPIKEYYHDDFDDDVPPLHWLKRHKIQFFGPVSFDNRNPEVNTTGMYLQENNGNPIAGRTLAELNDHGASFQQIADVIEANLEYTDDS